MAKFSDRALSPRAVTTNYSKISVALAALNRTLSRVRGSCWIVPFLTNYTRRTAPDPPLRTDMVLPGVPFAPERNAGQPEQCSCRACFFRPRPRAHQPEGAAPLQLPEQAQAPHEHGLHPLQPTVLLQATSATQGPPYPSPVAPLSSVGQPGRAAPAP